MTHMFCFGCGRSKHIDSCGSWKLGKEIIFLCKNCMYKELYIIDEGKAISEFTNFLEKTGKKMKKNDFIR